MPHDRQVALANLDLALGRDVDPRRKYRMAWGAFERAGAVVAGMFWGPRLSADRARKLVNGESCWNVLRELKSRGKGVVVVTTHYGDWELLCLAAAAVGFPMMMVTEAMANPRLDALFNSLRGCTGNVCIPPMYAALKLLRGLRRGERVGLMCDVNGRRGRGGVWVDFFGKPVFNGAALAELALRADAAVVFAVAVPQRSGNFHVEHSPPIEFTRTGDHAQDVQRLTQQVVDLFAAVLRRNPEPWLWTYKRWKRRPTPDAEGYPFYSRFARVK
jgi:KDO2-lipid IV(A) lauroyltransferase